MVNVDPSEVDTDLVPETTEPIARDTHDNLMLGVYRTERDGVWALLVFDWANRVVEATVYGDVDEREEGGVSFRELDTPEEMDAEAYLREVLGNRVEALADEERAPA